jgi:hypothetical protein
MESTPSTTKSAMYPPIGKPTRIATGHSHIRRAVLSKSPGASVIVPPLREASAEVVREARGASSVAFAEYSASCSRSGGESVESASPNSPTWEDAASERL